LLRLAEAWFDAATVSRVFEPLIADWQRECAPKSGLARIACRIRGAAAFAMSFTLTFAIEFRKPLPIGLPAAAYWTMEVFAGATLVVLYLPYAYNSAGIAPQWLLASSLALALPIAITPASIVLATRMKWPRPDRLKAVARMTLITAVLGAGLLGWVTPYSNQQYRMMVSERIGRDMPARGVRELTLPELAATVLARDHVSTDTSRWRELNQRVNLMLLPITLAALGLAVARKPHRAIVKACFWWIAAPAIYLILPGWRAHIILLTIAVGLHWLASRVTHASGYEST
jgi:hypothetical protein